MIPWREIGDMPRHRFGLLVLVLLPVVAVFIYVKRQFDPDSQSALVREVEAQGSGSLSELSVADIRQWLANRSLPFIRHVATECAPLREKADARWSSHTAEGRLCQAAGTLALFAPLELKADQTSYDGYIRLTPPKSTSKK
jgi:hypothetical protein